MQDALGTQVAREFGNIDQSDDQVDDTIVASCGGSMMETALGGGWSDPDEVIAMIEKRTGK